MRWHALWPLGLVACLSTEGGTYSVPLSAGDTDPVERRCEVAAIEQVADLSARLEGYGHSPEQLLSGSTGEFHGILTVEGHEVEGMLHLDERVGEVRQLTARWTDDRSVCATWLELELSAWLWADHDLLDEVFSAVVRVEPGQSPTFEMSIPQAQIRGLLQGDLDAHTPLWLTVEAAFSDGWAGALRWWTDPPEAPVELLSGSFSFSG